MSNSPSSTGGIGFTGLLTITFIVLKLIGVIAWSWWWVLSPIWISFGIVACVLVIVGLIALIVWLIEKRAERVKMKERGTG